MKNISIKFIKPFSARGKAFFMPDERSLFLSARLGSDPFYPIQMMLILRIARKQA